MKPDYPDKNKRAGIYGSIVVYKIISLVIVIILTVVMTFTFFIEKANFENMEGAPAPTIFIIMAVCIILFIISIVIDFYILHRTVSIGKHLNRLAYIDKLSAIIQDPDKTQELYDAWCTEAGVSHVKYIPAWEDALLTDPAKQQIAARLRNLHTCESHCAMITRAAHLIYKGRIQEAEKALPELRELQKMPL